MGFQGRYLQAIQKPHQFAQIYLLYFLFAGRPPEPLALEPLLPETESVPAPVKYLDYVSAPVAEDEQIA